MLGKRRTDITDIKLVWQNHEVCYICSLLPSNHVTRLILRNCSIYTNILQNTKWEMLQLNCKVLQLSLYAVCHRGLWNNVWTLISVAMHFFCSHYNVIDILRVTRCMVSRYVDVIFLHLRASVLLLLKLLFIRDGSFSSSLLLSHDNDWWACWFYMHIL